MATYSIKAPDGNTYQIDGPDGASQEQVQAEVLRQHPTAAGQPANSGTRVAPSSLLDRLSGYASDAADNINRFAKGFDKGVINTGLIIPRGVHNAYQLATGTHGPLIGDKANQALDQMLPAPTNFSQAAIESAGGLLGGALAGGAVNPAAAAAQSPTQVTNAVARDAGYVLPPSEIENAGTGARALGALAGTRQINQAAAPLNNAQTTANLAKEFGLPPGTPMTPGTTAAIKAQADQVGYQPIRDLGTAWDTLLKQVQSYRDTARQLFKQNDVTPHVDTLAQAKATDAAANAAEGVLEQALKASGNGKLYDGYTAARTTIAKANDVDRALQVSSGTVQGAPVASAFGSGKPLTGAIGALGRTAELVPQAFAKPAAESALNVPHTAFGAASDAFHAGMIPLRKLLMSGPAQDYMTYATPEMRRDALVKALAAGLGGVEAQ